MIAAIEMHKTSARDAAQAIVQGVDDGREDIFPDPMAVALYESWPKDHKAIEWQFAGM